MPTKLIKGNDAVVVGALYAGCNCFFGYPITPASEILHAASDWFPRLGRKFVQAESEEAAINMVYGAAAAGHRAMTASSGPGISLKQEAISYFAGTELPCVVVDIVRAGPGLGNIGPEQGDYNQIVKGGGHGNYRNIVLAPNSVQEMCDLTRLAFELAHTYRGPAFVLADGTLGQMIEPLVFPDEALQPTIDESWAVAGTPGTRGNFITSIILDFDKLEALNVKLQRKYAEIEEKESRVELTACDDADIILCSYGISSRIAKSAVHEARRQGFRVGLFRPQTLFPLARAELREFARRDVTFVSVEMSNGQFRDDLRLAIDCSRPVELINRYGGNLIPLDAILDRIAEIAGRKVAV
ncbi:MAG: 3-methyl-2-oxobutanoate dehydrogenase subunit VorB [Victivallales bacterium]|nr:3-methyl-2-oxobutanoate dehydrogenase subunit VorB [Victivallales bacterium]